MKGQSPERDGTLRLLTMNLWGIHGAWPDRRALLLEGLDQLRPDLLTLQETIVTDSYDQVLDLLGERYHIAHQSRDDREPNGSGISIASRWPLENVRELDLHVNDRTANFACTTMLADVSTPAGPLLLVNHFPSWKLQLEAEREAQAVIAAQAIEQAAPHLDNHVLLAGDFDADPAAASIRFFTGRQSLEGMSVCYRDAWASVHPDVPGHTYTPDNEIMADGDWPFRRIDHILVRCGEHGGPTLTIRGCQRIFDRPRDGVWASDHFGLIADVAPPAT